MEANLKAMIEHTLSVRVVSMPYGTGVVETDEGKRYYMKKGRPSGAFACEAEGLAELAMAGDLNVPGAALWGRDFILTDYIPGGRPNDGFYGKLGRMVARMHRHVGKGFGFRKDNYIGQNPQPNIAEDGESTDWAEFYYNKRLKYQLEMALTTGYFGERVWDIMYRLRDAVNLKLGSLEVEPSLLHGDLWSGNYLCSEESEPYLIDPAIYYGHRETDIAMTMLFGGFPPEFYDAYDKDYPLDMGWRDRIPVYQLYHVLNHLNIFGSGYLRQAMELIDRITGV